MKINKLINLACLSGALILGSCSDDDDTIFLPETQFEVPATYVFERNGESTVSFGGQTTRIAMSEEIVSALKNETLDEATLANMFAHVEGANDFSTEALNDSDKSVRSKTAASRDYFFDNVTVTNEIKEEFDGWIKSQVDDVFTSWTTPAVEGTAGFIEEGGADPATRYVNANGLELNQAFGKGLIGALMVDQALNNYLGTLILDEADNRTNNDNGVVAEGKNYTTMEHKWDEAYGYLYGASVDAANPNATIGDDDSFLNKYIGRVENDKDGDFTGIAADIYTAFKLGRAAIVAKRYDIRDAQAAIIREKISQVIGVRAVYYLQQGKSTLEESTVDYASAFHDLSEGYGFIYSLQFTRNPITNAPYFSRTEVEGLLNQLMGATNGLWNVTPETLQTISETIAAEFSFTVEQAGS
ncbi:DUF4856 domain-containing protein [Aquimarina mytili]|uniref:DUF4856 domain-containing protein n=1 Tax=Aquimarina mytili TaxID=874423 RepID=A0A936ZRN2_9FLAO|nr:DUF4856 domain-containing protein [Aquimarina mytili]MBL0684152.1 DUF4856 domain-containing protein [Aquimarina mytili]